MNGPRHLDDADLEWVGLDAALRTAQANTARAAARHQSHIINLQPLETHKRVASEDATHFQ
jgi:hypothetical protein